MKTMVTTTIGCLKYAIVAAALLYALIAIGVFALHTQMPVTFWLAVVRSALWPLWFAGGLQGTPLAMD